jgi:predicted NACHT family NTPase
MLASILAATSIANPSDRIPVLVRLGELAEESRLDGLFGTLLASRYRVENYHYELLRKLNRAGRLLIILDALDEMKHGMTIAAFRREIGRLFELHEGDSRLLLLGRPNALVILYLTNPSTRI